MPGTIRQDLSNTWHAPTTLEKVTLSHHPTITCLPDTASQGNHPRDTRTLREQNGVRKEWFYAPTVLLEVRDEIPVCQEEIFGPLVPVLIFHCGSHCRV
jgi:hypothetical protein